MSSNTHSIGDQIRSGLKGIHGAGEAIRGTAMEEVDKAFDPKSSSKAGPSRNQDIADKGVADVKAADNNLGHNHGVNTGSATTTTANAGAADTVPATSAGAHSVAPGNIGSTGATVGHGSAGIQEQPGVNQRF